MLYFQNYTTSLTLIVPDLNFIDFKIIFDTKYHSNLNDWYGILYGCVIHLELCGYSETEKKTLFYLTSVPFLMSNIFQACHDHSHLPNNLLTLHSNSPLPRTNIPDLLIWVLVVTPLLLLSYLHRLLLKSF